MGCEGVRVSKTIVVGASSNWRDYAFCVPLASLLWRDVVGFTPYWYLIGTKEDWEKPLRNKAVTNALTEWGIGFERVEPIEGYEVSTQAQNIRHHATCGNSDDWLMMTDADLFPMKRDFYHQHDSTSARARAVCYYSNGNNFISKENVLEIAGKGGEFQDLPTCHLTMKARTWRELFGNAGMTARDSMKRTLDAWLRPRQEGKIPSEASWQAWLSDQRISTEKLCHSSWFPQEATLIQRDGQPPRDRLDRAHPNDWKPMDVTKWTDCHTLRPADVDANWEYVRPIFAALVPQHMEAIDGYRKAFTLGY